MSIINVLQWNGPPSVLAWRHPNGEIMAGSQLIVKEHQHAVLMREGRMIGPFLPGRHSLDSKNYPVLKGFIGLATGGASPFPVEVWFVNRTIDLNVRWGTSTPMQVKDPAYGIMIPVMGYGMMGVTIADTKKFLLKLVGSAGTYDCEMVEQHFRAILLSSIKSHVARAIAERGLSILDLAAHVRDLSDDLGRSFAAEFAEFGLSVVAFRIESITTREGDPAVVRLRDALARKAEIQILGTDFAQSESFEVMKRAAANEGGTAAPFIGAGLGLGMGAAIGGQAGVIGAHLATQVGRCGSCGDPIPPGAKYCPGCGKGVASTAAACRACGSAVPSSARFCPSCGAPSGTRCVACGAELAGGARFCPGCGRAAGGGTA